MTNGQQHALNPLLTKAGEAVKLMDRMGETDLDLDQCSPVVYLTLRQWRRILEEFGCQ